MISAQQPSGTHFTLFKDGLIYRGKNCQLGSSDNDSFADDEVEMEEIEGSMWYLNYPLEDDTGYECCTLT